MRYTHILGMRQAHIVGGVRCYDYCMGRIFYVLLFLAGLVSCGVAVYAWLTGMAMASPGGWAVGAMALALGAWVSGVVAVGLAIVAERVEAVRDQLARALTAEADSRSESNER